jgi:hypothetical protein
MEKEFNLIEKELILKIEFENEEIRDKITFELQEKFNAKVIEKLWKEELEIAKLIMELVFVSWSMYKEAKKYLKKRQKEEKFKFKIIET